MVILEDLWAQRELCGIYTNELLQSSFSEEKDIDGTMTFTAVQMVYVNVIKVGISW